MNLGPLIVDELSSVSICRVFGLALDEDDEEEHALDQHDVAEEDADMAATDAETNDNPTNLFSTATGT